MHLAQAADEAYVLDDEPDSGDEEWSTGPRAARKRKAATAADAPAKVAVDKVR